MFDKKDEYRTLTGGGHKIHATNDEIETNHDLTLLLDKNIEDFLKENDTDWDGNIEELSKDLFGNEKWNTVSEMFYALNNCANYAILRNYESLPNEIYDNDHNDIDIICDSLEDVAYVLNAKPVFEEEYRVHYKTNVENRIAYFDLRHIGDNYYFEPMERKILQEKVYNEKGFYTLNDENYFYTLMYHALLHKPEFKLDYKEKLIKLNIQKVSLDTTIKEYAQILKKWMIDNEYIVVDPIDKTVLINITNAKYFEPILYRKEQYELIQVKAENENLQKENSGLKEENEFLKNQINELTRKIEGIEDSRTWKIMKPIRKIKEKIKF
jgi:cell division protein FtsB